MLGPAGPDLLALPEGPIPVPPQPRRARLSSELAARLDEELLLGQQELRLWCMRLRQEGLSLRRIADLLDCGKSSVARYCAAGRAGIDRQALILEREERVSTPPYYFHVYGPQAKAIYARLWERHERWQPLFASLRPLSPAELEERVLLPTEDPPETETRGVGSQVPLAGAEHQPRDPLGRLLLHRWDGVRVGVQGDRDGRVPEALTDDLGMDAGLQGQGGMGVSQVVQSDRRQQGPVHGLAPVA